MPGSGKSTVAELLSEKLGLPFFDLDLILEIMKGMPITKIFAEEGEDEFRQLESNALLRLIDTSESYVMATGGGTPCFFDQIEKMNQHGITVFLNTPVDTLITRVKGGTERPLLMDDHQKRIEELLNERINIYKQSQFTIDTKGKEPVEIATEMATFV